MTNTISEAGLLVEQHDGVCRLTLNRPERRNALSQALLAALDETLVRIGEDPEARVVVLAANGPVFCSGHDLKEMNGRSDAEYRALFSLCARMMQRLREIPQPVVAQVQGMATAAGCQLVAACDLAVASTEAWFATPGVRIGLFCTTPMVPLVRAVPPKVALEMLLTGEPISAERALQAGLVNRIVPADQLRGAVSELAQSLRRASPLVLRIGKRAFYEQLHLSEADAYQQAVEIMTCNAQCVDAREGISAFLDKRPPQWKGE